MWNNPPEVTEQPSRSGNAALGAALLLFVIIVLSNLLMLRPRLSDRLDAWSTRVMQAEYVARMLYGTVLPFGEADATAWEDTVKLLSTKDAPLGALVRAVILLEERSTMLGQPPTRGRLEVLLKRMPAAPTQWSPDQKQAVLLWCQAVYGERRRLSPEEQERFRRTIEELPLGWMRWLALKHLATAAGDTAAARRWEARAREGANRLQRTLLIAFGVVAVLMLTGVSTWVTYAVWKSTVRTVQPIAPALPAHHIGTVTWGLVVYLAAMYLGGTVAGLFAHGLPAGSPLLIVLVWLVQLVTGGVAIGWLHWQMKRAGISWREVGWNWTPLAQHLAWGTAAYVAMIPVLLLTVVLVQVLLPEIPSPAHPIAGVALSDNPPWVTLLLFLMAAVFAPLFEEVFFRGVLLSALWRQTGNRWVGIIGSALFFSVLHPQMYFGWIVIFVVGVMLGALFVERGSLLPCIWMHALNNAAALLVVQLLRGLG
ncbi:MAG: CPBP family intramembrane metalloprotease [bacterium]|nr:CPBP family intramembrane metalloprotease [bacterium]